MAAAIIKSDMYFLSKLLHFILNTKYNIITSNIVPIITEIKGSDGLLSNILREKDSELYKKECLHQLRKA